MKLITPNFSHYKALEVYEYIKEPLEDLRGHNYVGGALQALYEQTEPAFNEYDQATYRDRVLPLTDELKKHDTARDAAYSGLHLTLRGYTHHYTPAVAEAAKAVLAVFKKYPTATREGYNEETGIITNLCQDLLDANTPGRLALEAADTEDHRLFKWVENLRNHNNSFRQIIDQRYASLGKETNLPLIKDTRPAAVAGITAMLEKLAALVAADVNLNTSKPLLATVNQRTEKYNAVAKARRQKQEEEAIEN